MSPDRAAVPTGRRRARDGPLATLTRGNHRACRQRRAIHVLGFRSPAARSRPIGIDGARCLQRRQRAHRIVLVHHAPRTPRPAELELTSRTRLGDLRMDRRLVQPPQTALDPGNAVTTRIRNTAHRRRKSGMITKSKLSGLPGQAPWAIGPPRKSSTTTPAPQPRPDPPRKSTRETVRKP